mmetsp:Transcript_72612/g.65290  ORF Transcript_72612/g.65290 Transcript_72612/m.65290 type:complete len:162 (-) Transcript_72612:33-518(-)
MMKITALVLVMALGDAKRDSSRLLLQAGVPQGPPVPPPPPGQGATQSQGGAVSQPLQPAQQYNPMNNMNNPYCNPISGMYDFQDCLKYGVFFGGATPSSGLYGNPGIVGNPGSGNGYTPGFSQPQAPANPINRMNPYCNPYSGMYDIQDCYEFTYGFNPVI